MVWIINHPRKTQLFSSLQSLKNSKPVHKLRGKFGGGRGRGEEEVYAVQLSLYPLMHSAMLLFQLLWLLATHHGSWYAPWPRTSRHSKNTTAKRHPLHTKILTVQMKTTFKELWANYEETFIHIHRRSANCFVDKNRNFGVGFEGLQQVRSENP